MALKLFMCGHGAWAPDDGFTEVPKGCSVTFYTYNAKTMLQGAVNEIVSGRYTGDYHQKVEEYKQVQNMTLYPDDEPLRKSTQKELLKNPDPDTNCFFTKTPTTLEQFFKVYGDQIAKLGGIDVVWTCCRFVDNKGEKTGVEGFNATEDLVNDVFIFRDADRTPFKIVSR